MAKPRDATGSSEATWNLAKISTESAPNLARRCAYPSSSRGAVPIPSFAFSKTSADSCMHATCASAPS